VLVEPRAGNPDTWAEKNGRSPAIAFALLPVLQRRQFGDKPVTPQNEIKDNLKPWQPFIITESSQNVA
jgi:hypothetical protein